MPNIPPVPRELQEILKASQSCMRWFVALQQSYINQAVIPKGGTAGHVIAYDSSGNVVDSGKSLPLGDIVGTTDAQTLTDKTLTEPIIADFANATHNHQTDGGGALLDHGLSLNGLSDDDHAQYHNDARHLLINHDFAHIHGLAPFAYPIGLSPNDTVTTALTLPAVGGLVMVPLVLSSAMLLQSLTVRNANTSTERTWAWALYVQTPNLGAAGENSLVRVAASNGSETFTPSAASNRVLNAASPPVRLYPGCYWAIVQNLHATSAFDVGCSAAGTMNNSTGRTETIAGALPDPFDSTTGTWPKIQTIPGIRLNGRVFGQTGAF